MQLFPVISWYWCQTPVNFLCIRGIYSWDQKFRISQTDSLQANACKAVEWNMENLS